MRWFLVFLLAFEGLLIHQTFYHPSKIINVVGFFCLIPVTLWLAKMLFATLLVAIFARLGWLGAASDTGLLETREQDDSDEEEVSNRRKWKLPMETDDGLSDLGNPLNPLSPLSPMNPMNDHHHHHHNNSSMF